MEAAIWGFGEMAIEIKFMNEVRVPLMFDPITTPLV